MKKFLIIAAIVVVVVIIVLIILLATKGKQMMDLAVDRGLGAMEQMMIANRPSSVSEDSIKTVLDATIEKIRFGDADPKNVRMLMMKFQGYLDDKSLDSLEVKSMLEEMNRL